MNESESCVPPGFRFHPTEEELVGFYLKKKVNSFKFDIDVITDIDLYRIEPWDIQDKCKLGYDEQNEWYFFSYKDRKYPSGTRTNRATRAGFWKATGRDKAVLSNNNIIGMRKTLVFYKGRAPNGNKSDWIMHEYRLQHSLHAPPHQEEGWVVCRAFKKPSPSHTRQGFGAWNHPNNNYHYYMRDNNRYNNDHHARSISSISNPTNTINQVNNNLHLHQQIRMQPFGNFEQELISNNNNNAIDLIENQLMIDLPRLDSPSLSTSLATTKEVFDHQQINNEDYEIGAPGTKALVTTADNNGNYEIEKNNQGNNSSTKWEILDSFLASQIQETTPPSYSSNPQSLRLVPCDYELDAQNQSSSYLGCFNNL